MSDVSPALVDHVRTLLRDAPRPLSTRDIVDQTPLTIRVETPCSGGAHAPGPLYSVTAAAVSCDGLKHTIDRRLTLPEMSRLLYWLKREGDVEGRTFGKDSRLWWVWTGDSVSVDDLEKMLAAGPQDGENRG